MTHTEKSSSDSNPFLVRTVQIPQGSPQEIKSDDGAVLPEVKEEGPTEPPIELHEKKFGLPYVAELLDLSAVYGKTNQEDQIAQIDQYILQTIGSEGLKSTKTAYQSILQKLEQKLEIDAELDYPERIEKLYTYVKMLQEQKILTMMRKLHAQ